MKQYQIAEKAGISAVYLSQILMGIRRPSWPLAKVLARITKTNKEDWMDQKTDKLKKAIKNAA